jgi:hypothetical protein
MKLDQYNALAEASLREILRLLSLTRTTKGATAAENVFPAGSLRDQLLLAEQRARHLLTCKPD